MGRLGRLLFKAFALAHAKSCFSIAKGAAYSGLLGLFPVLSAGAAMLAQIEAGPVQRLIAEFLRDILPPGTQQLVLDRFVDSGHKPVALLVSAGAVAVYAASGLMLSLMEGFNAVYRVSKGRTFLRQRLMAALLTFATAIPAVAASTLIVVGVRTEQSVIRWLRGTPEGAPLADGLMWAGYAARHLVALAAVVLVTALLYGLGPNRRQTWRNVWPGAITATVMWLGVTAVFGWYVRNLANYNVLYGSLGTVIALLVWMYVMAAVAFLGCAFNAVREKAKRRALAPGS